MGGRDHETDHDGECFRECKECYIKKLELSVENLQYHVDVMFKENVRRREAIEKHKRTMDYEKIQDYYFDRALWSVLDGE